MRETLILFGGVFFGAGLALWIMAGAISSPLMLIIPSYALTLWACCMSKSKSRYDKEALVIAESAIENHPVSDFEKNSGEKEKIIVWFSEDFENSEAKGFLVENFPFHADVIDYQYCDKEKKIISGVIMTTEDPFYGSVRDEAQRIGLQAWVRPYSTHFESWERCRTITGKQAFQ